MWTKYASCDYIRGLHIWLITFIFSAIFFSRISYNEIRSNYFFDQLSIPIGAYNIIMYYLIFFAFFYISILWKSNGLIFTRKSIVTT